MKVQFQFNMGGSPDTNVVAKMCAEHPECKDCPLFCETGINMQGGHTICDTAIERIRNGKVNN